MLNEIFIMLGRHKHKGRNKEGKGYRESWERGEKIERDFENRQILIIWYLSGAWREWSKFMLISGVQCSRQRICKHKGLEAWVYLICSKNSKEVSVAGAKWEGENRKRWNQTCKEGWNRQNFVRPCGSMKELWFSCFEMRTMTEF